jgi:anti-sigma factor RsiW
MMNSRPITEEELLAYVDELLDTARRKEVEAYLAAHPDVAHTVVGYIRQRDMLRAALAPIAEEPVPPQLNLARLVEQRLRPSRLSPWRAAAAALVLFGLGGAGGWSLHGIGTEPVGITALAQEAALNYAVFGDDHVHPVEFKPGQSGQLMDWISSRLNISLKPPDLSASGYRFMGGRLVATAHGPAGLLMYDNGLGNRLVMFVRPMDADKDTKTMMQSASGPMTGFSWAHNGIGYSLVGTAAPDILHPLANTIRLQLTPGI